MNRSSGIHQYGVHGGAIQEEILLRKSPCEERVATNAATLVSFTGCYAK
jgi:hypothetical protein